MSAAIRRSVRKAASLRRAILLREILGAPVAVTGPQAGGAGPRSY